MKVKPLWNIEMQLDIKEQQKIIVHELFVQ